MARGLFAVYRDDTAGPSAAAASGAATCAAGSTNRGSLPPSRRHDGSTARLAGSRGLGLREKENLDPFAVRPVRMGKGELLGKGKLAAGAGKGGKVEGGVARPAPSRRGLGASAQVSNRGEASVSRPSENGICTGSLRTRVLPDLPPLPAPTPEPTSSSSRPTTVRLGCPDGAGSAESSPRTSCDTSFGSATDSGYAQSPRRRLRPGASPAEEEHGSEVPEAGNAFEDETDSDMSMVDSEVSGGVKSADRRARALTESPLAEVTEAFTGLGGFSVANMSPSPAAAASFRSANHNKQYRPSTLRHQPTSPSRKSVSHGGAASSTAASRGLGGLPALNATTKRIKPGQAAASAPKAAPNRTLRF
ncbi:hypothetical protein JCM8202_000611 [Rhodotorula sphaerocarpa]